MRRGADAGRGIIELAGIGFAVGDEVGVGFEAKLRRNDQDLRRRTDTRDRHQILEDVVGQRLLQRRIDDDRRIHQHDVVAVGVGMSDEVDADNAARARAIIGDDRLAEILAHLLRELAAGEIDDAARSIGDDQVDRPRRKIVGTCRRAESMRQQTKRQRTKHAAFACTKRRRKLLAGFNARHIEDSLCRPAANAV